MLKLPFRFFTPTLKNNLQRPVCARLSGTIPIITDTNGSFESYLQKRIKMKGPLTVAEYMKEVLGNPKWVRIISLNNFNCFIDDLLFFFVGLLYEKRRVWDKG